MDKTRTFIVSVSMDLKRLNCPGISFISEVTAASEKVILLSIMS